MAKLVGIVVVIVGLFFAWTQFGGSAIPSAPQAPSNVQLPDASDTVNGAGEGAKGGAEWFADFLESLTPTTWGLLVIGLAAFGLTLAWRRSTKFKFIVIGLITGIIVVISVTAMVNG